MAETIGEVTTKIFLPTQEKGGETKRLARNLNQALLAAMDAYSERTCFHIRRGKRYQNIPYLRFQRMAFRLVNYFHQQGISNGERVVIIADNPLEWMVVYVACLLSGGVVVPLRAWLSSELLHAQVEDCGATLAVVQGEDQRWLIEDAGRGLPDLKTVLPVTDLGETDPGVTPISTILAKPLAAGAVEKIRSHAQDISPEAPAAIYYKSGKARGALFDHGQRLAAMQSMAEWFTFDADDIAITTIISWNLSTIDTALHYFLSGVPHIVAEGDALGSGLQTSPTIVMTTPSGFEGFYNFVQAEVEQWPESRQTIFHWAFSIGKEYRAAGLAASKELQEAYERAERTVFNPIRAQFGGRLKRVYSTGAPLPQEWADYAEIINGVQVLNNYSLTEAGGYPAVSQPDARRPDSCGQVAPGFQIRIADDGEILVRGPMIMREYWQHPEDTHQVLDGEGWLHTGDLGRFDPDGFLYLTGHKLPVMLLSTGRAVTPSTIENALTASPYVERAVIFGEGRLYVTALIVPDLAALAEHIREHADNGQVITAGPKLIDHPLVKSHLDKVVAEVNSRLDDWEKIEQYTILNHPLTEGAGELTRSQKIRRDVVKERYAEQIEAMYPSTFLLQETVTEVQLDPEHLRELLEKQDILDAWLEDAGIGFLFDLARDMQIDGPSMVHISETAASIAQMQSEEKPLSTALIIGDPVRIARHLPESEIQLHRYDHIRRMRPVVVTLAKMVDGLSLGYVVDQHGYVRGVHKLEIDMPPDIAESNFLFGPQFRHHAAISLGCNAVIFFVPAGGRQVRVFAGGQLVGRYAHGIWSAESISHIDQAIARLAEEKAYDEALLQRVMSCAFQMSERNLGAIFLIGDAEIILDHSDPPEISAFATIATTAIDKLTDRELINFAKQDGATVIGTDGQLRGTMVLLRPDANTQAEIGPGKGARHSSAAKMSAEANCLAITVSQDGPITLYDSGQQVLSL